MDLASIFRRKQAEVVLLRLTHILLCLGTVVGVVLYTGRELRSVMNTSNPRSKVGQESSIVITKLGSNLSLNKEISPSKDRF